MAATVALTADFARRLGGGRFAQSLAGLCVLLAPALLAGGVLLSTDCLQALTWLACAWILVRLVESGDERWWLAFGAVVGVSFESKYLIASTSPALAVGVVATPLQAQPGAAVALRRRGAGAGDRAAQCPLAGAARLAVPRDRRAPTPAARASGCRRSASCCSRRFSLGRPRRRSGSPACGGSACGRRVRSCARWRSPMSSCWRSSSSPTARPITSRRSIRSLFAAGGVAWEAWLKRPAARWIAVAVVVVPGLFAAPIALPILPPDALVAYMQAGGFSPKATQTESMKLSALPQYFADMFGWREMAAAVSAVYRDLPPDERAQAVFFAPNYGEAAALDVYGPALGGPPTISAHNSYFLWGPRGASGEVVITLGRDGARFGRFYDDVRAVGRIDNAYAMPYENGLTIWVLRRPRAPLAASLDALKHYD